MKVVTNNLEHFTKCSICGKEFDMRNLGQVLDHEHTPEHKVGDFCFKIKGEKLNQPTCQKK